MGKDTGIKVAVVTGGHAFDVVNFHDLFRGLEGIDAYIQHLNDFSASPEDVRDGYDVVLFYFMPMEGPSDEGRPWFTGKPKTALEHLGTARQGIVILHHALLAYPEWQVWNDVLGIQDRSFGYDHDQVLQVQIADTQHPITQGLTSWEMGDETYTMNDAGDGSTILLTVEHPRSIKTLAWTRTYKNARVFCFQSGHDNQAWTDAHFRGVLARGIRWAARRI